MDRLEEELEGQAQVLRLDVMDSVGGELAMRYGARGVPTFVVLDGAGQVLLVQAGMPDRDAIKAAIVESLGEGSRRICRLDVSDSRPAQVSHCSSSLCAIPTELEISTPQLCAIPGPTE